MKNGLISDGLNNYLNSLVGECFLLNRVMDRNVSILSVKFVMNNSVKYLHQKFSHRFPILGDIISDYQGSRNCLTVYPATPEDASDYATPLDLFNKLYDYQITFENSVKEVIEQAKDEGDLMTKKFLEDFLFELSKYTNQIMLLCDKAESYGTDYMSFDRDIKKFFLFGDN
jgi:hypothetical protein